MMLRGRKYLFDILRAIELAEDFVADMPDFSMYQADAKTRSAMERQLAIVGEAVNQLRREWPETVLPDTRQIVDFRNRLIHSYDNIDDVIVWAIPKRHLPALKSVVEQKLAQPE